MVAENIRENAQAFRSYLLTMYAVLLLLCFFGAEASVATYHDTAPITKFVQGEMTSLSSAQSSLASFLKSKNIPIGELPGSLKKSASHKADRKLEVILSEEDNNIECRVALERAPIGSKCVAPCACTGSQKWIQFAVLNRMRRGEPAQWKTCQTCQTNFDYGYFMTYGGELGNVVSTVLDNPVIIRSTLSTIGALLVLEGSVVKLMKRFLLSRFFWNLYPKWSRIVHLPLVLKFWGGKVLLQYMAEKYLQFEKVINKNLTELESKLIEERLPVTANAEEYIE